jgi:hypothetical protein
MLKILEITEQDIQTVKDRLREMQDSYQLEANVHDHAGKLGLACKTFLELDNKYDIFSSCGAVIAKNIYDEIKIFADNDANVVEALNAIQQAGDSLEKETGLNAQDLLIRAWVLADHCFAGDGVKAVIIENLKHNKATGGGCLAGITARLTQPYCSNIRSIVDGAMQNKSGMSSTDKLVNSNDAFEEELQIAMALSLSSSNNSSEKKRKFIDVDNNDNNNNDNDADFQKALILSRQSQQEEKDFAEAVRLSLQSPAKKFRK